MAKIKGPKKTNRYISDSLNNALAKSTKTLFPSVTVTSIKPFNTKLLDNAWTQNWLVNTFMSLVRLLTQFLIYDS